jgi:hypothetical protein
VSLARVISVCIMSASFLGALRPLCAQTQPIKKDSIKIPQLDSVTIGWQDGKLQKPTGISAKNPNVLKDLGSDALDGFKKGKTDKVETRDSGASLTEKNSVSNVGEDYSKRSDKADSLHHAVKNGEEVLAKRNEILTPKKIYSQRKVKAIYDSMGIGKADTLKALASMKKDVSSEEMLQKINDSFLPKETSSAEPLADLSNSKLKQDALQELPPMRGRKYRSTYLLMADSLLARNIHRADSAHRQRLHADSVHDSRMQQLQKLDSLNSSYQGDQVKVDSIVSAWKAKGVSVPSKDDLKQWGLDNVKNLRENYSKLRSGDGGKLLADSLDEKYKKGLERLSEKHFKRKNKADSLKQEAITSADQFKVTQKDVGQDLTNVMVENKRGPFKRLYFEGLASGQKTRNGDEIHLSPAVGFEVTSNFSVGIGPNLILWKNDRSLELAAGCRTFAKYQILRQRAYVQVEDLLKPVYSREESGTTTSHSILAGAGVLVPISKKLAVNALLLYNTYSNKVMEVDSRWIFRLGISTIHNKKIKK